ncbi:hypothetical protein sos41_27290 [Alphaproteobacteria bacterium SO-S41]|nr:hypothetical protein sos41_27290 [Alphaproteobacteria bacterium SO-S41]
MTCTTHFTDANSCGYLMSRAEFDGAVRDSIGDPAYRDVAAAFAGGGWRLVMKDGQIAIDAGGRSVGLAEAYVLFADDHVLHERVYQRCMTIWR